MSISSGSTRVTIPPAWVLYLRRRGAGVTSNGDCKTRTITADFCAVLSEPPILERKISFVTDFGLEGSAKFLSGRAMGAGPKMRQNAPGRICVLENIAPSSRALTHFCLLNVHFRGVVQLEAVPALWLLHAWAPDFAADPVAFLDVELSWGIGASRFAAHSRAGPDQNYRSLRLQGSAGSWLPPTWCSYRASFAVRGRRLLTAPDFQV